MTITAKTISISRTLVDNYIWNVKSYMMRKYGCDTAEREIYPLVWYIETGRASAQFLGDMVQRKPYMIGRLLHQGGSDDLSISRIRDYIS